jgi:CRISPR-associated endonuclease/helicase Cas3
MTIPNDAAEFKRFFCDAMRLEGPDVGPYEWQVSVAVNGLPDILPIPTGLGKTEGAVLAWAWRKFWAGLEEPLHLVYCLPMRVLVQQTVERLNKCFEAVAAKRNVARIPVYPLMGGMIDEEWASNPDHAWILVGTQDQLLSRALNRGYSMSRFEWPVHFGLLNQDCHWIVDEVQLMGPGLWTTAQLDWMRRKRFHALKACRTTWMSATVGEAFLATTDRKKDGLDKPDRVFDPGLRADKNKELQRRLSASRSVDWFKASSGKRAPGIYEQVASRVVAEHCTGTLSLVICNAVKSAQTIFRALPDRIPKILLTSRFRPADRRESEQRLLAFEAQRSESDSGWIEGDLGLICVSTQVVEAGLDISAHRLWSALAPWPSAIQRLGRLNRDGRDDNPDNPARAWFWREPKVEKGPYQKRDVEIAWELIAAIIPQSGRMPFEQALNSLDEKHLSLLKDSLQPEPTPTPRALDVHGLFSTERDLLGGFTDVSGFVRNADPEADLIVFWRAWQGPRPPVGEALDGPAFDPDSEGCPVAVHHVRDLLQRLRATAWIWSDEDERWESCAPNDLRPGMIIMLHREAGGYRMDLGWTGDRADTLTAVPAAGPGRVLADDERTESSDYVALSVHLKDARAEAERICNVLGLSESLRAAVVEAAGSHDIGKSHPKWQSALPSARAMQGGPWAKAPRVLAVDAPSTDHAYYQAVSRLRVHSVALPAVAKSRSGIRLRWVVDRRLNREELERLKELPHVKWAGHVPFRPAMRHEAASALSMWARYREGGDLFPALAVYLAGAHHGKVRTVLRSTMRNGGDVFGVPTQPDSLTFDGRVWSLDFSVAADGAAGEWTEAGFRLTDHGWTGLVADLLGSWRGKGEDHSTGVLPESEPRWLGPFALAWLEALVRIADWRASASPSAKVDFPGASNGK